MRKVLVLMGDGINSENELARAFNEQGAFVDKLHVNELLHNPHLLLHYGLLALPGGFSFGDEIRSGKILAEKLKDLLISELKVFLSQGGRVIGICNGFQVLAQLGVFDWGTEKRSFTLAENSHGKFMDKWVKLEISPEAQFRSPWFKDLNGPLYLPVRHGEGRIVKDKDMSLPFVPLNYEADINGSYQQSAGVLNRDGSVFGLMPHPEVATQEFLYPFRNQAAENVEKIHTLFKNGLND
jgi:phosphoribosylformylglycinamidine (FGAM) synthase-like amidotransferase family enzyme